jgi:diaminopimelate epimerase
MPFWKLTGSGNDFVFFDGRDPAAAALERPDAIARLCDRRRGIGGDGVVWLQPATDPRTTFRMVYYNADGSRAAMCGNAALCSTRLAVTLGIAPADGFAFESDVGPIAARLRPTGDPEVSLRGVTGLDQAPPITLGSAERRAVAVDSGVPHLVVEVADLEQVDVLRRGRALRFDPAFPGGVNVDFVAPDPAGGWGMRTYERGVEGETLACGTGSIATAAAVRAWGSADDETVVHTRSGLEHRIRLVEGGSVLSGEGRVVFTGALGDIW